MEHLLKKLFQPINGLSPSIQYTPREGHGNPIDAFQGTGIVLGGTGTGSGKPVIFREART